MTIALARTVAMATALLLTTSCGWPDDSGPDARPAVSAEPSAGSSAVAAAPLAELGAFPDYPAGGLPADVVAALQDALDTSVEDGTVRGATVGVVVIGDGSWAGAAGTDRDRRALTVDSRMLTASVGKTITTAQVMRLVDEGRIDLDAPAADYLPAGFPASQVNGASVRDLLGMRSGFADPAGYVELVDDGLRTRELLAMTTPTSRAGTTTEYANLNFLLLGEIIQSVTGRPMAAAIRDGVLDDPALDGIHYGVKDAMAADGWRITADPGTLARWGHQLYGGFVVSREALREMTDFRDADYGLGTIDLSGWGDYDSPGAVGHGGLETRNAVRLVFLPEHGVVVSVQANAGGIEHTIELVSALAVAARP